MWEIIRSQTKYVHKAYWDFHFPLPRRKNVTA